MASILGEVLINLFVSLKNTVVGSFYKIYHKSKAIPDDKIIEDQTVIAFIHGRNAHYTEGDVLIKNLYNIGIPYKIIRIDLGDTSESTIEHDADTLSDELSTLINCKIVLLGMSKGGLVASHYISTSEDPRIVKIITISSPLYGTKIANLSPSKAVNDQLGYNNSVVLELSNKIKNINIPFYHIVPKWDHVIIPNTSAFYNFTPLDRIYFDTSKSGHLGILNNENIANIIYSWIIA